MKTLILSLFLALATPLSAFAAAGLPQPAAVKTIANLGGSEGLRKIQLGTQLVDKKVQVMKAKYDFAVQGGAIGSVNLVDVDGKDAVLPNKAIIKQVIFDVITAPTSGGSATIAFTANSAADMKAALAIASWTGIVAGIPVGTAATSIKLTAQRTLTATIATAALTAGKINVFVEYYISD
jgi:hypothetical protein